jgi:hypothetical protein
MNNNYFEAVEVCPHCMSENIYPMWDTEVSGFVAVCNYCGEEILLCDECQHTILQDGEVHNCDWCETECGGRCHRGEAISKKASLFDMVGKTRGIAITILEMFENMLEEKGIMIPDEDRTGDDGEACLYGMTYGMLEDEITALLCEYVDE